MVSLKLWSINNWHVPKSMLSFAVLIGTFIHTPLDIRKMYRVLEQGGQWICYQGSYSGGNIISVLKLSDIESRAATSDNRESFVEKE